MKEKNTHRDHADFQDNYRRSSNFRSVVKRERLELNEDGEVVIYQNS